MYGVNQINFTSAFCVVKELQLSKYVDVDVYIIPVYTIEQRDTFFHFVQP